MSTSSVTQRNMVVPLIALAGLVLLMSPKKASASSESFPPGKMPQLPPGWRRAKSAELTPEAIAFAKECVKQVGEIGLIREMPNGDFAAFTEWHYHEPNGPAKPWGWHHGITMLVRKT